MIPNTVACNSISLGHFHNIWKRQTALGVAANIMSRKIISLHRHDRPISIIRQHKKFYRKIQPVYRFQLLECLAEIPHHHSH